jgi:hypothetical protein
MQWLRGGDVRLRRAAAQLLGLLAEVEGEGFSRRMGALLPLVGGVLRAEADADDERVEAVENGGKEVEDLQAAGDLAAGWREAYYCLVLLHKVLEVAPASLAWEKGVGARRNAAGTQHSACFSTVTLGCAGEQGVWVGLCGVGGRMGIWLVCVEADGLHPGRPPSSLGCI